MNWIISIAIYFGLLILAIWSFLSHAAPHRGVNYRLFGVLIYIILLSGMGYYGTKHQYIRDHPKTPSPPQIMLDTMNGYPFGTQPEPSLRWNTLLVRNTSDIDIYDFSSRIQLPEAIIETGPIDKTVGINAEWRPFVVNPIVSAGTVSRDSNGGVSFGGHSVLLTPIPMDGFSGEMQHGKMVQMEGEETGGGNATGIWDLSVDKLPPNGYAAVTFITSNTQTNYNNFAGGGIPNPHRATNELRYYLDGEYYFRINNQPNSRFFIVPIIFDRDKRSISLSALQTNVGNFTLVKLQFH